MTKVLVVVAHPDDEVLGCGASLARHIAEGDEVKVVFLADGVSAREGKLEHLPDRRLAARLACQELGVDDLVFNEFPDNQLDTLPLLQLAKAIERQLSSFQPDLIYTHYRDDLNVDHRAVCEAVMTACRPQPGASVREVRCMEVLSSTEWRFDRHSAFTPTLFVTVEKFLDKKLSALSRYDQEMRAFPHPRSQKAVTSLAALRGSIVGVEAAEAFDVLYRIV